MNEQLARTLRCLPSMSRIDRKPLYTCLGLMGATPPREYAFRHGCIGNRGPRVSTDRARGVVGAGFKYLSEWELHDLYIECHKIWVEGCKIIQTHLVENHEAAAKWNALWARTEQLLKRKGVEMT